VGVVCAQGLKPGVLLGFVYAWMARIAGLGFGVGSLQTILFLSSLTVFLILDLLPLHEGITLFILSFLLVSLIPFLPASQACVLQSKDSLSSKDRAKKCRH